MTDELTYSAPDVLGLLDDLLTGGGGAWWDQFWADRDRPIPFRPSQGPAPPPDPIAHTCRSPFPDPAGEVEPGESLGPPSASA
jgi:hypothetical protein